MRKKIGLFLILFFVLFLLTGCGGSDSNEPSQQTQTYYTTLKIVNSDDEIIETSKVTIEGETADEGSDGLYSFNLKKGTYTVDVTDTKGKYEDYKGEITVTRDNQMFTISLFKNIKTVEIKVLDDSNNKVENSLVNISGETPSSINDNLHYYNLEKGESYDITAKDEFGYYLEDTKTITIDDSTQEVVFNLEPTETSSVSGNLTLSEEQNSLPVMNAVVSYGEEEVITDETGYFRLDDVPSGDIQLKINTLFTDEQTKNIRVSGNYSLEDEEKIIDFSNFPEDDVLNGDPMYQGNNNKFPKWDIDEDNKILTYDIDYSEVEDIYNNNNEYYNMEDNIEEGIKDFEKLFKINNNKIIEFERDTSNPDIIINIVPDGSIGGVGAGSSNKTMDNITSEIKESVIKLNAEYMIDNNQARTITAHELAHSLGISHSSNNDFLMYSNASNSSIGGFDDYINSNIDEHKIFGLLYSVPVGSDDFITN